MGPQRPIATVRPRRAGRWGIALAAVALATVAAGGLAGCGSDDPSTAASTTAASTTAAPAATNAITIKTPGMEFQVSGALRPGYATITLDNTDDVAHMMSVVRMKDGATVDQVRAALGQDESAAGKLLADPPDSAAYGTPAPVGPGESTTVTAEDLQAGTYVVVCFFTDDAGKAHWMSGMLADFTVEGAPFETAPKTDGTIAIDDDAITLPEGFTGTGTFEVTNSGKAPHSISIARLDEGTTLASYANHVGAAMGAGKAIDGGGGTLVGGVEVLAPGQRAFLTLDLQKGHYGYISTEDANGPGLPPQHGEFDVA